MPGRAEKDVGMGVTGTYEGDQAELVHNWRDRRS